MRRVNWFVLPALMVGLLALAADDLQGQPPGGFGGGPGGFGGGPGGFGGGRKGGFGGGGPGGFDPNAMWDRMAQGQDSINLNDPRFGWMKGMMERQGTPVPTNGILTKQQFVAGAQQRMAQMQAGGGPGGFGGGGGRKGGFGGQPGGMTLTFQGGPPGATGQPTMIQTGPGGFGGGPGMGGPGGGFDPASMPDDTIRMMMRRTDTDGDGRISAAEAQANDRMRDAFARFDTNRDGFIDATEYRAYLAERMSNRGNGGPGGGPGGFGGGGPGGFGGQPGGGFNPGGMPPGGQPNFGGQPGGGFNPQAGGDRRSGAEVEETVRPEVHRYGKLPKGIPTFFEELDGDKDGMVGLYEWRRAGRPTASFVEMDLNADGYLTADEWLRFQKQQIEKRASEDGESPRPSSGPSPGGPGMSRGGPPGGSMGGFPGSSGKDGKRNNREGKKGGRNPFNNG
ncbi:MAG: EF-hand domain-containing protein [Gemmataceae bacterium]